MTKCEINTTGYAFIEKTVTVSNNTSGKIYVPRKWVGKKVLIILKEPLDND